MKIGIFDSGLGGLIITKAIRKIMPEYDYVYLGDTKRVPYGSRSHETVFEFTKQAVDYLFKKEDCAIVIIACNTASARALGRIQREYLPAFKNAKKHLTPNPSPYKVEGEIERRILGVLIPTAEECAKYKRVGILGTLGTITSNTFPIEIKKILALQSLGEGGNKKTRVFQNPAPMLVSLAEIGEKILAKQFIIKYLKPLLNKKLDAIALGCTHYPFYKTEIRKIVGKNVKVISQDEIIPKKLKDYFKKHPEIKKMLSKNKQIKILLTDITKNIENLSKKWFGEKIKPKLLNF